MRNFFYTIMSIFCAICGGMHVALAAWDVGRLTLHPTMTIPSAIILFAGFVYFGNKVVQ